MGPEWNLGGVEMDILGEGDYGTSGGSSRRCLPRDVIQFPVQCSLQIFYGKASHVLSSSSDSSPKPGISIN